MTPTKQDQSDLVVLQRIHRLNPHLKDVEQLVNLLKGEVGHEPSKLLIRAAQNLVDPYRESREIVWWKMTGRC